MATIFYAEPELVIGHGRRVLFVNPNDLQLFKEIEVPADLATCGLKAIPAHQVVLVKKKPLKDEKGQPEPEPDPDDVAGGSGSASAPVSIQNVCYSPDRQLLAISTSGGQKALLLYASRPENARLLSARSMPRASSAMRFCSNNNSVLVTDKTGDCYQFNCVDVEAPARLLLGHLSVVYDILWTNDQQHIITCDRDDKIRVTNYPATFDINSYCLGHKEFVSGMALLTDQHLVSASGDRTLRVWQFLEGLELLQHLLPAPAVRLQVQTLDRERLFRVAVLLYDNSDALTICRLERTNCDAWAITAEQFVRADSGLWSICNFSMAGDRVYITGAENEQLAIKVYDVLTGQRSLSGVPDGWIKMVLEGLRADGVAFLPEDLSVWFKKRFDNVSDYLERKKRRVEEQQKKGG
ncbi:hypothetical protein KR018_005017 [Drosophila ironensis]|nr:hypothetical protein KR018_005017 [Drosophila ironensis]